MSCGAPPKLKDSEKILGIEKFIIVASFLYF